MRSRHLAVVPVVALLAPLAACGGSDDAARDGRTLTVFAAASLTKTFTALGERFEADHDGVRVRLSLGGSADLVQQIRSGAPADVFASADTTTMGELGDRAQGVRSFASNTLEIAVPPGNPARVAGLADLARPEVRTVVCAPAVPCGTATATVATRAGVTLRPVSEEQSVTDVLGKVASGEADAGVVYVTDVRAAGDSVEGIAFPEAAGVVNVYPIAEVDGAEHEDLARQFIGLVLSPEGQRVLADAGFGSP